MRIAVLTISDRASAGVYGDEAGPIIERVVTEAGHEVVARALIPDDRARIEDTLRSWADADTADAIISTGGTGLGARDVTPEAARAVFDKEAPGIAELIRSVGMQHTPFAALSRQVAGVRARTLIVTLPGSPKAVSEGLDAVMSILTHAVEMIRA